MNSSILLLAGVLIVIALLAANKFMESNSDGSEKLGKLYAARRAILDKEWRARSAGMSLQYSYVGAAGNAAIGIDADAGVMLVVSASWPDVESASGAVISSRLLSPSDLLSAELREFYDVSGDKGITAHRARSTSLYLFIDDLDAPVYQMEFLDTPASVSGKRYQEAHKEAATWEGRTRAFLQRGRSGSAMASQLAALQASRGKGPSAAPGDRARARAADLGITLDPDARR